MWGGIADPKTDKPWERDTIIGVFSTTKGATAICANKLAQEGQLDIDAPVASYWPEFAAEGKGDIPVRYLLSHRAGLAWVDEPLTLEQALAWEPMIHALEHQKPSWEPGTAHGYHAITYGYLVGEVVRRITGRTIGTYFREEIAEPLGLDFWIGLPGGAGAARRDARRQPDRRPRVGRPRRRRAASIAALMGPDSVMGKALSGGGAFAADGIWNTRAVHAAEVPAAAGISDARSIARMYAACVGEVDGIRILTPEQGRDRVDAGDRGPEHGAHEPRSAVRARVHRAVDARAARWPALVRPLRRGRLGRLGRPRRRVRLRLRDEPHGHGPRRRPAQLAPGRRLLRRDRLMAAGAGPTGARRPRVGMLAPMQPELQPIVRRLGMEGDGSLYRGATSDGVEVVAMLTNIGMANGADAARRMLEHDVDHVMVVGIAGGVDMSVLQIGDVIVPEVGGRARWSGRSGPRSSATSRRRER